MKNLIYLVTILLIIASAFNAKAQMTEGVVADAQTHKPLSFVNVGIVGKNRGTVTDDDGRYKLLVTNSDADSVRISMIGYRSLTFSCGSFSSQKQPVLLEPLITELKEVKVSNRKLKQGILGNTTQSKSTDAGFTSNMLGNEIGALIKTKRSPTYLDEFNASIAVPPTDSVKFRLNFYSVSNDLPDKPLETQSIFVTVKRGQGKINVDLRPYNIVVQDKFIVTLECIQKAHGHGIMFSGSLLGGALIARDASQAAWERESLVGLGFNVLAEY